MGVLFLDPNRSVITRCACLDAYIHGPPGTGKSETIANIIADCLANKRRVLMVSQKKAALDIVFNRLGSLQSKIMLIHDAENEKREFYRRVTRSLRTLDVKHYELPYNQVDLLARQIDRNIEELRKNWEILNSRHECGLALHQLYVKSKGLEESDFAKLMIKYRRNNIFHDYSYKSIRNAQKILSSNSTVTDYVRFRQLSEEPYFELLKDDIDTLGIMNAADVVENFKIERYEQAFTLQWYQQLLPMLQLGHFSFSDHELEELLREFIQGGFPVLFEPVHDGKWWKPSFWIRYKTNKRKLRENSNVQFFLMDKAKDTASSILLLHKKMLTDLKYVREIFIEKALERFVVELMNGNDVDGKLKKLRNIISLSAEYSELRAKMNSLAELERILIDFAYEWCEICGKELSISLDEVVQGYLLFCLREHESNLSVSHQILDANSYKKKNAHILTLMKERRQAVSEYICRSWSLLFNKSAGNIREFTYQAQKRSKLWPVREYVGRYSERVLTLFPCWLMGPEAVSDVLPLKWGLFDVIIFDEASQMFVQNAIPAIYRAKQMIIAGDRKQLRPDDLFLAQIGYGGVNSLEDEDEALLELSAAMETKSLLDLAVVTCDGVHLNFHYRSQYTELIEFSNYGFYDAQLNVSPNKDTPCVPPIERIKVDGSWSSMKNNHVEAKKVVELVEQLLRDGRGQTIGVVTFNIGQQYLIQDLLEQQAAVDPSFAALLRREQSRVDGNQDVGLFVKNIENVQGDERDIIIFSIAYGRDKHGRVKAVFGSLNRDGGPNRLNVAVSRARKKIYLVTSIEPEELDLTRVTSQGPVYLKSYLQYAKAVSERNEENARAILADLLDPSVLPHHQSAGFQSEFEEQVAEALWKKGYDIHSQIGVAGYHIDLGVYDASASRYILGIECDGATYHSSKSARERDIHRQLFLESRGWTIVRVWSRDWWQNNDDEVARLVNEIELEKGR